MTDLETHLPRGRHPCAGRTPRAAHRAWGGGGVPHRADEVFALLDRCPTKAALSQGIVFGEHGLPAAQLDRPALCDAQARSARRAVRQFQVRWKTAQVFHRMPTNWQPRHRDASRGPTSTSTATA